MKIAFTPLVAYRLIYKAKRNFLKSKACNEWKAICRDLPVLFRLSNKLSGNAYGMATLITKADNKNFDYGIVDEPMVKCSNKLCWLVIELNAGIVSYGSPKSNFKLVTHEFAHCLDFVLRGKMMPAKICHDQFFQDLNRYMGGGDIDYVSYPKVKDKIQKSLDSFNGEYMVAPSFYDLHSEKLR